MVGQAKHTSKMLNGHHKRSQKCMSQKQQQSILIYGVQMTEILAQNGIESYIQVNTRCVRPCEQK